MTTRYFVQLTDRSGAAVSVDGGSVFEVSDVGFGLTQATNSSGPAGVGFGPLTVSVSSSGLSNYLSNAVSRGLPLNNLDLFAVSQDGKGALSTMPAVHDGFTTVFVTGESIDAETGLHTFTLAYRGVREGASQLNDDTGRYTGTTVTAGSTNGHFTSLPTPIFSKAVTSTAAADQNLDTYVRITDAHGTPIGASAGGSASGGWILVDSATFGGSVSLGAGQSLGAETLSPLQMPLAPGILEPSLLGTMTAGQSIGIELASYTRANASRPSTLIDDVRPGNALVTASSRTSDAAVKYTIDYSQIASSHTALNSHGDPGTITTSSYNETNHSTATNLPNQAAPNRNIEAVTARNIATGEGATVACFARGTMIATSRGEVPVEALAVGDVVVTASNQKRLIRWIGHRHTDFVRHPERIRVMPVRIKAGAVAPGLPKRDLRVSPDHAIGLDDVLVKATRLVNGASIVRESVTSVTYWHIELDSHDLLVAEGIPAESYIEADNRHAFVNGGAVLQAHPDFEALGDYASRTCLPLVEGGEQLKAIRAKLFARVADRFTADHGMMLVADGVSLAPQTAHGNRYRFAVPEGVVALRLISRFATHSEVQSDSRDHRRFGVLIRNLTIDGVPADYDSLGSGWNDQARGRDNRWTDGDAAIPAGRIVEFVATTLERYPRDERAVTPLPIRSVA